MFKPHLLKILAAHISSTINNEKKSKLYRNFVKVSADEGAIAGGLKRA